MKKQLHVVPKNGKWAVKKENSQRASKITNTQKDAIHAARDLAKAGKSEVLIHGKNGQIRERSSYGNDPFPPKG